MKKLFMVLPLVFLLCFTFSCQYGEEVAEEPVVDVEADVEAIKGLGQVVMKAFSEEDLDSYIELLVDDAVWMPPDAVTIIGKEKIRNHYNFELYSFKAAITVDEVQVLGDWAFVRDTWKGTVTQKESGETNEFDEKNLFIMKRQLDGYCKITHAIWNYNPLNQE
jgi:uncharacterized protein (TIGR02246 family)